VSRVVTVARIGPEPMEAAAPPVIITEVTSPVALVQNFLGLVEGNENEGAYDNDKRVPVIVAALARVGVREVQKILGSGSFGVAALTVDNHVVKLTGDVAEVQVGAVLVGKNLPHVVAIYGSWYVRGAKVRVQGGWDEKEQEIIYKLARVGILMEQKVETPSRNASARKAISDFVFDWKEKTKNRFEDYARRLRMLPSRPPWGLEGVEGVLARRTRCQPEGPADPCSARSGSRSPRRSRRP
jgi:hypothetical protein